MAALNTTARLSPCPPTEVESRLALESSRRLGPSLVELSIPKDGNNPSHTVGLIVQIPGGTASEPMMIPASALRLLGDILTEMSQGNAITLTPVHAELTTRQAADILNVSRPFLCKLLDNDDIPHRKVGRHQRVRFVDLMDYKNRIDEARAQTLDELVRQAQELDLGY